MESLGERRLCLLYYHFFNFVALCHVSRQKLYNAKYAHSIQVLTVHSLSLTETKLVCPCHQSKGLFWCEDSCHSQDPGAAAELEHPLTKNMMEKSILLWHKQCSASVLGKCGPDVLPCLKQILLLFTFALQL